MLWHFQKECNHFRSDISDTSTLKNIHKNSFHPIFRNNNKLGEMYMWHFFHEKKMFHPMIHSKNLDTLNIMSLEQEPLKFYWSISEIFPIKILLQSFQSVKLQPNWCTNMIDNFNIPSRIFYLRNETALVVIHHSKRRELLANKELPRISSRFEWLVDPTWLRVGRS